ncbi:MAG: 1,2-phenylacetyl-CoA epoxidase subunit PaaD, partial [Serpentinimonas sp.]|nr:1,2-phenylacetyl-CoA epoxidase subunit PaaD [Serpentinimonas sp.]
PGVWEVLITPTYNGCPAMGQIEDDVRATVQGLGLQVRVLRQLAPAWSTDAMSPAAHEKLRAYGIAAPLPCVAAAAAGPERLRFVRGAADPEPPVPCPRCASLQTVETSHFGSTACKALYKCLACQEPFDYFKPY